MSLTTMYPAKNNSPKTVLAEDITADATSLTLADTSVLPAAPNLMVLGINDDAEIVKYTAISGDVVSGLVRGVNGTTPGAWAHDTIVARNFTAQDAEAFRENILDLESRKAEADNVYTTSEVDTLLSAKQDTLTFDDTPTASSNNPVKSGGIYTELAGKAPLSSPALTGSPTAPTAALISTSTTQIATCEFVSLHTPINLTVNASRGSTATKNDNRITSTMQVKNVVYETPKNVTSNVSWTTANGSVTFTGTFTGATAITFDVEETLS